MCGRVDQCGSIECASPGEADAGSAVTVVMNNSRPMWAGLLFEADLRSHGANADPMLNGLCGAEPRFEGDAAGEDSFGGLRIGFPVQRSGFSGSPEHQVFAVWVDRDEVG